MAKVYKAGQVAAALFSKKNSKSNNNSTLTDLFSGTRLPSGGLEVQETSEIVSAVKRVHEKPAAEISAVVKKKKKKTDEAKDEKPAAEVSVVVKKKKKKKDEEKAEPNEFPFQHEFLIKKEKQDKELVNQTKKKKTNKELAKEDETSEKRPRRNRKRDKAADKRTIFVGNCPLSADKKVLKTLFKDYGEIDTIRFRCAPAADPNLPRRAIVITKNFNEKCKSYIAYIVFKDEEAAKKALEKNGHVLDGLHLRVDIASASSKADKKRSVFLGNLPFDVQEDEIRGHFTDCGDITNVRIVRDRQTSLGKGIAYVSFESKDSVGLSLKLNGSQFQNRRIRVMGCSNKAKDKDQKEKKKESNKKSNSKSNQDTEKKRLSFAPSNVTNSKFKTILQTKKEKRLRKLKKKASGKKTDAITAVLGEAPSTPKQVKNPKKNGLKKGTSFKKGPKSFKGKGEKNKVTSRSKAFKQKKNFGRKK